MVQYVCIESSRQVMVSPIIPITALSHQPLLISTLEPLPLLRRIPLLQKLPILLLEHKLTIPHRLLNPLLTPQPNNRHHALPNRPRRRHTRHAHPALLRHLLHARDDFLVDGVLAAVDELLKELVRGGAFGGARGPGAG